MRGDAQESAMTYTLRLRGVTVGWTSLEEGDPATGTAAGALRPGVGYELVEPIFQLRTNAADQETLRRYRDARATLPLELVDARGTRVRTTELVIVPAVGDAAPRLEARIEDPGFWREREGA